MQAYHARFFPCLVGQVEASKIPDLLEANEVEELIQRYLDTTRDNMTEWMKNSLTSDKVDIRYRSSQCGGFSPEFRIFISNSALSFLS